ncbi:MAG TPA: CorA family divalent cation transporter [Candidatus Limnocylindria bacterium]|nr:CorA family divalent cation transporter [Candidatus Limnocylindria bacterium]
MSVAAILSHADGSDEAIDIATWQPRPIRPEELLWIDATAPSADDVAAIARALGLGDELGRRLDDETTRPSLTVHSGAVEVVVRAPGESLEDRPRGLRILVGEEWIVTAHAEPLPFLDERRERIQDQREVGRLTPVQFLVTLLTWHVDAYLQAAEQLENDVDRLDDAALRTEDDLLQRLVDMRRRIARVRRMLVPHREVVAELALPVVFGDLEPAEREALGAMVARVERAVDAVLNAREMLIGTFDIHMTRTAQRTNDIVRVLTWASVVLLPASVLAGVMGMNFHVGFFDDPTMFWVVLGAMILIAVVTLALARWRRWL